MNKYAPLCPPHKTMNPYASHNLRNDEILNKTNCPLSQMNNFFMDKKLYSNSISILCKPSKLCMVKIKHINKPMLRNQLRAWKARQQQIIYFKNEYNSTLLC